MRDRLHQILRCPACRGTLTATAFASSSDQIVEGVLTCGCGLTYPIIDTIPRMLTNSWELFPAFRQRYGDGHQKAAAVSTAETDGEGRLQVRTQESFGYQWTTFADMACDFEDNFLNYLHPATPDFFSGKLGLDAGCGFGRHIYHAAQYGAEMVGVDFSRAIESSHGNTKHLPNVHLVQADIYALPFSPGTFDFAYSVGVLHHLPDPPRATAAVGAMVKPGGTLFIWVYSKKRRIANLLLETVRVVTSRLPHAFVNLLSFAGAAVDRVFFIAPYHLAGRLPLLGQLAASLTPARIKMYSEYPFQVLHADWFDRLAAPIRFYYDESGAKELLQAADVASAQVSPTGLYGWRGCGIRQDRSVQGNDESSAQLSRLSAVSR